MSTVQELSLRSRIEALENRIAEIQKKIEKLKKAEEEPKEWVPKNGEEYWYIASDGMIYSNWGWNNTPLDIGRLAIGNVIRTLEEAEFAVERLKVLAEMKRLAEPNNREWCIENGLWFIQYDIEENILDIDYNDLYNRNDIYFESCEQAKKCIESVGADRIKKYYLGVEE